MLCATYLQYDQMLLFFTSHVKGISIFMTYPTNELKRLYDICENFGKSSEFLKALEQNIEVRD